MPDPHVAKVLIIQGEASNREFLATCLRGAGHEVHQTKTAGEGFKFVAEHNPDLILAGLELPDLSGFELSRRIKTSPLTAGAAVVLTSNQRGFRARRVQSVESSFSLMARS